MDSLSSLRHPEELALVQPISEEWSLATISPALSPDLVAGLGQLMAQVQARFPGQKLPEGTPEMYLTEWSEMANRYGRDVFKDALLKVIRTPERAPFFPAPDEIDRACRSIISLKLGRKAVAAHDEMKAKWEREREEDLARGLPRSADAKAELDALIGPSVPKPQPKSYDEQRAWIAQHVRAEDQAAVRERMQAIVTTRTEEAQEVHA